MRINFTVVDSATQKQESFSFETVSDGKQTYTATVPISRGGNGIVVKVVIYKQTGGFEGPFALKILNRLSDQRRDRFLNEIDTLTHLDHPNILKLITQGNLQVNGFTVPWMIMDLGGYNLDIYINGREFNSTLVPGNGPLDVTHIKKIGIQMCEALKHLHSRGFIHRDIKPQNFVWRKQNDIENISMIDFGIAKPIQKDVSGRPMDTITLDNERVGPFLFFSPELIEYARDKTTPVDHRSDMWQLSRVIWFMATGKVSTGRPSKKIDPTGGILFEMVDKMSNDDPDERFQTIDEMIDILNKL